MREEIETEKSFDWRNEMTPINTFSFNFSW